MAGAEGAGREAEDGSLGGVLHKGLLQIRAKMALDTPCKNVSRRPVKT